MDDLGTEDMDAGNDCQTTGTCTPEDGLGVSKLNLPSPSLFEQSMLAAQQFGVIVGVALLVGSLFMLMIAVEIGLEWLDNKCAKACGRKNIKDVEAPDPAALVGSFKRYK